MTRSSAVIATPEVDEDLEEEAPPVDEHAHSRVYCRAALVDFRDAKAKVIELVRGEVYTKRRAIEALRKRYLRILTEYLRINLTTYSAWLECGPVAEWDECLAAEKDDAAWDRLIDRGLAPLR